MRKTVKIWLITAAVLVTLGSILFAGVMANSYWDFTKLSTVTYVNNTYVANGEFDKISINVDTTEIEFVPAEDESCRVVCYEMEKAKHSVSVQNGTLFIDTTDTRKWYDHICISLGSPKLTVYLPQNEYAALFIQTATGDVTVPKDFTVEMLKIDGDTSDVDCCATVSDSLEVELATGDIKIDAVSAGRLELTTDTGNIEVNAATVQNAIDVETDTGRVKLTAIACKALAAESDTGTVTLQNVVAAGSFVIESDTGDVRFDGCDAAEITVKTSTGDVTGTLLSEKVFITETSTGRVSVPKSVSGGRCEVTTSTGDIKLAVTP